MTQRLRTGLRDELGLEPGPQLRGLEVAVLRQDAELTAYPRRDPAPALPATAGPATAQPRRPVISVPRQLPTAAAAFAGRAAELARLDSLRGFGPGGCVLEATRYDKLAARYEATTISMIDIWLRKLVRHL